MRLKEDNSSWKSGGIRRRMYRQAPLLPEEEEVKYRSKHGKPKPGKLKQVCKHVWVEVSFKEFERYATSSGWWFPRWWETTEDERVAYWTAYHTYFVCASCLATKSKTDKGKMR